MFHVLPLFLPKWPVVSPEHRDGLLFSSGLCWLSRQKDRNVLCSAEPCDHMIRARVEHIPFDVREEFACHMELYMTYNP